MIKDAKPGAVRAKLSPPAARPRTAEGKVVVIGGGLGGLSCAIHLAAKGCRVTLLEKEPELGGKLQRVEEAGYRFDNGPSTMTMQPVFDAVFTAAGRRREDYLTFHPLDPIARNSFHDGTVVEVTPDASVMEEQIAAYSPEDARNYRAFMEESRRLYRLAEREFLSGLMLNWRDKLRPSLLSGFCRIKPLTSMERTLRRYFRHPHTLAMFGRYATYVGSAPQQAPSIFNMMAHVESGLGVFAVQGGTYSIVEAFGRLASELGVDIRTGVEARRIVSENGRAVSVDTDEGVFRADAVVVNADPLSARLKLLPEDRLQTAAAERKLERLEPSVAGFVLLLGVCEDYGLLRHHNVFFPEHYAREFDDLFRRRQLPEQPAIYVCRSGGDATRRSLFVLVNAPACREGLNYEAIKEDYAAAIVSSLEQRGLHGLGRAIQPERGGFSRILTPDDLERRTGAWRGTIYGASSNRFSQAFFRFPSRDRDVRGLWYVGGSTHPGGGTPIVTMGGRLVAERLIGEELGLQRS
ncbi:phytoene desaturase family protein [Paenibacillus pasadenensis]|uniref:phytoene desaturase family protein n=1 Tax=Paenibacillus pasadenensis TaxID=217090 RepID=UPI00203C0129|nr:phytoene desaturase family protein [Paenibacillus pasadenensis]MCM3747733.1 phytoene desaturase family protein [Paenibacillus pasadenensis]